MWFSKRYDFIVRKFFINSTELVRVNMMNGDLFPVSDACSRQGDPGDGCIYTASSFFSTTVDTLSDVVSFVISDGMNLTYFEDSAPLVDQKMVGKASLHCSSTTDCHQICKKRSGYWIPSMEMCNITLYLSSLCYRLQKSGEDFTLDTSGFVSKTGIGCYQSNGWSPYLYTKSPANGTIPLEVV